MSDLREIPISEIIPSRTPLRPVQRKSLDFTELFESIKTDGVLQPILVRPIKEGYEVVEGGHRFVAAKMAGLETIPCKVKPMTDHEVLVYQVKANAVKPKETTRYEYARRLRKLLEGGLTIQQLSAMIDKSPNWIRHQLSLNKLIRKAVNKLNNGDMCLSNAVELSKLPDHLQLAMLDTACHMRSADFISLARQAKRDYDAFLIEQGAEKIDYGIQPRLRPINDIMLEVENNKARDVVLTSCNATTPEEGWKACLAWMLRIDPYTISLKQQKIKEQKLGNLNSYQYRLKQRELIEKLTFDIGEPNEQRTDTLQSE